MAYQGRSGRSGRHANGPPERPLTGRSRVATSSRRDRRSASVRRADQIATVRVSRPLLSQYVRLSAISASVGAGCTSPSRLIAREAIVCWPGAVCSNRGPDRFPWKRELGGVPTDSGQAFTQLQAGRRALPVARSNAHPGGMAHAQLHVDGGRYSRSAEARRSLHLLWWIPASPIVGFVLASMFVSESWPLWQVIPLAVLLAAPFVAGALYGYTATRRGDKSGWIGLVIHVAMAIVAIVMPISESINN